MKVHSEKPWLPVMKWSFVNVHCLAVIIISHLSTFLVSSPEPWCNQLKLPMTTHLYPRKQKQTLQPCNHGNLLIQLTLNGIFVFPSGQESNVLTQCGYRLNVLLIQKTNFSVACVALLFQRLAGGSHSFLFSLAFLWEHLVCALKAMFPCAPVMCLVVFLRSSSSVACLSH